MDDREQLTILEAMARDPETPARERVAALRLLREIEASLPRQQDGEGGEVASMEAFMERRGSDRPPRGGRGGELLPPGP